MKVKVQESFTVPDGPYCLCWGKPSTGCAHYNESDSLDPVPLCEKGFSGQRSRKKGVLKSPRCASLTVCKK